MKRINFVVSVSPKAPVSIKQWRDYLTEACRYWSGQFDPMNPLFHWSNSITVKRQYKKRK